MTAVNAGRARPARTTQRFLHGRVELALHTYQGTSGPSLVLLHGLGEASPAVAPAMFANWPGSIHALDFTGHGASSVPAGGGYSCEVLMADVDGALARLGPSTIFGRGLGGYVGLLIAGARASLVRGLLIDDGAGLTGGGVRPGSTMIFVPDLRLSSGHAPTPDPLALLELGSDVRPPDYAESFVRAALQGPLEDPISVVGVSRPPWLRAVADCYGVRTEAMSSALDRFGRSAAPA